jgi:predicted DNA-binding transcriptional regulator AlpA
MSRYYTMMQVCDLLNVTRPTVDRWIRDLGFPPRTYLGKRRPTRMRTRYGEIVTKRSNCRIGFERAKVDAWIDSREVQTP